MLTQDLVHREHVYLVLLEHCSHSLIAADHALVIRILKVVGTHVRPNAFHSLRSR